MLNLLKNPYIRAGLLIGFIVFLIWIGYTRFISKSAQSAGCISPPVEIAYPYEALRDSAAPQGTILPPFEWKPQLSDDQLAYIKDFYSVYSMIVQGNDIWFTSQKTLARYRPSTGKITTYTVQAEGADYLPFQLFLSHDGTIWGSDHYNVSAHNIMSHIPGDLSRYNVDRDRFEFISDADGVLTHDAGPTVMTEDAQGRLWLIRDEVLFNFDPQTRRAERVLDEQRGYRPHNLVNGPDEGIWLAVYATDPPEDKSLIIRYDPHTGEIKYHGYPPDVRENTNISSMYFDIAGNLWVDNYGWRGFSPSGEYIWYKLIPSPVFITNRIQGAGDFQYAWTLPTQIYQSSNGLFWFSSGAGMVRFDLQSGEWCLFTTLSSPIVEDGDHNLWIAGGRQLYRYHLNP